MTGMARELLLGVDGGGTKTDFVLLERTGRVAARHRASGSYHLQVGLEGLREVLRGGLGELMRQAQAGADDVEYAFFGLPAHGEDSALQASLDALPAALLGHHRYRCGNDMICTWAGSLAAADGIGLVAGTGAIGYGECGGRAARASGWGELFGDEGSAYWVAIQGLNLFSRMSDGRLPPGPLQAIVRRHFELQQDLDLCARVMGRATRDEIAALSRLVVEAAGQGDAAAQSVLAVAGSELAQVADAIRARLGFAPGRPVVVSYSGGLFRGGNWLVEPLRARLSERCPDFELRPPLLDPGVGAALYAARLLGRPLASVALERLRKESGPAA